MSLLLLLLFSFFYFAIYDFLSNFILFLTGNFIFVFFCVSNFDTVVCSSILLLLCVCSLLFCKY